MQKSISEIDDVGVSRGLVLRFPPPKSAISFNERFMAARHEEDCYEIKVSIYFLVRNGLSNNDVGVARTTVYSEGYGREVIQNRRFR